MWQLRILGTTVGWIVVVLLVAQLLSSHLIDAAKAIGYCRHHGGTAVVCDYPTGLLLGDGSLPHLFTVAVTLPFTYRIENDEFGYALAFIIYASPIAFGLVIIAVNYWIWQVRRLLKAKQH